VKWSDFVFFVGFARANWKAEIAIAAGYLP
jgi:hypothetical protein